jgi:uncharacterized protein (TIGR03089 family)
MSRVTPLIADRLRQRARTRGGDPLVTYYDLEAGARAELSATSFLNWVDKTSNLFVDEYLIDSGDTIQLDVARHHPGHWITFALELAAWQVGAVVRLGQSSAPAELLVLGPRWESSDIAGAGAVLACAMHPLGLGFQTQLPAGIDDFSLEVRGQPDVYSPSRASAVGLAWLDDHRRLTQADLIAVDSAPRGCRSLVTVTDPWSTVRNGLLAPLVTDGSSVVVVGGDRDQLERVAFTERVDYGDAANDRVDHPRVNTERVEQP